MPERSRRRRGRSVEEASRVITDPRAIKALTHPARLAVLDTLGDGDQLTATECAAVAGISPSAMSYHLRALEKWGFVERAEASTDGRERPWRAVAGGWRIDSMPDAATVAATATVAKLSLDRLAMELTRWFEREGGQPKKWREVTIIANQRRWLTADEVAELHRIGDEYLAGRRARTAADHPPGARLVRTTRVTVPLQYEQ